MHRTVTPTDHAPANEAPRADPPAAVGAPRTTAPRYWCFISYRHANNQSADRRWATWLHQEIERYEVPAELVGRPSKWGRVVPERIYPVFRDEESAPADPELSVAIERALDDSSVLLVLCSPGAVESGYVGEEIRRFATTGRADRIITAVIDGDPKDPNRQCFPQPLRDLWAAQPHSDSPRGLSVATGPSGRTSGCAGRTVPSTRGSRRPRRTGGSWPRIVRSASRRRRSGRTSTSTNCSSPN
jgi:hypothetical protein